MDIEEIVRATVIALEERQMLKEWPTNAEMEILIGYVMEMESARIEEEQTMEVTSDARKWF